MSTNYPIEIVNLLERCKEYRLQNVPLDELKQAIWKAAQTIESSDEYEIRKSLQVIEGRLDMVQFTTDSEIVFDATLPIIHELEETLNNVLPS